MQTVTVRKPSDRSKSLRGMGFWGSLSVELLGGIATAAFLGVVVAMRDASQGINRHDDEAAAIGEDNDRWFRDQARWVRREEARVTNEMALRGQTANGVYLSLMQAVRQDALIAYRDEITRKLRRHRQLARSEGWLHAMLRRRSGRPLERLELTDQMRGILADWRARIEPPTTTETRDVADQTSWELEPDIREFELSGEPRQPT